MPAWVVPDVLTFMPPDLKAAYLLLTPEVAAAELASLLSSAVSDFRMAFNAAADPVGSLNAAAVPDTCLQRVRLLVWYPLALELGLGDVAAELRTPWQDAEVYLRQMLREVNKAGSVVGVAGTPRYTSGPREGFQPLSRTSAAPPPATSGVISLINYAYASPPPPTMV
jgi:hypothetical protein